MRKLREERWRTKLKSLFELAEDVFTQLQQEQIKHDYGTTTDDLKKSYNETISIQEKWGEIISILYWLESTDMPYDKKENDDEK